MLAMLGKKVGYITCMDAVGYALAKCGTPNNFLI